MTDVDFPGFHNHHPLPPREPYPGCVHGEILLPLQPTPLDLVVPLASLVTPNWALLSGAPCPPCVVGVLLGRMLRLPSPHPALGFFVSWLVPNP